MEKPGRPPLLPQYPHQDVLSHKARTRPRPPCPPSLAFLPAPSASPLLQIPPHSPPARLTLCRLANLFMPQFSHL